MRSAVHLQRGLGFRALCCLHNTAASIHSSLCIFFSFCFCFPQSVGFSWSCLESRSPVSPLLPPVPPLPLLFIVPTVSSGGLVDPGGAALSPGPGARLRPRSGGSLLGMLPTWLASHAWSWEGEWPGRRRGAFGLSVPTTSWLGAVPVSGGRVGVL